MKYLYLIDYWVPFPSSEYGGTISVIAENDQECHDLLRDGGISYDDTYDSKIMQSVVHSQKFALAEDENSRVVDSFTT
jgi:hypothetical protein